MHPKLSVYIAMSLDGFIAKEDGDLKWLNEIGDSPTEDYGFHSHMQSLDTIVLGRKTYETCSEFQEWPYTNKRTLVLSRTRTHVRPEAELYQGDIALLPEKLAAEGAKKVWIDGGLTVSAFLGAGLVDDITITVIPILLGSGIPLFSPMKREQRLHLSSAQSYPSGLVQLRYDINRRTHA